MYRVFVQNRVDVDGEETLRWNPIGARRPTLAGGRQSLTSWQDVFRITEDNRPLKLFKVPKPTKH